MPPAHTTDRRSRSHLDGKIGLRMILASPVRRMSQCLSAATLHPISARPLSRRRICAFGFCRFTTRLPLILLERGRHHRARGLDPQAAKGRLAAKEKVLMRAPRPRTARLDCRRNTFHNSASIAGCRVQARKICFLQPRRRLCSRVAPSAKVQWRGRSGPYRCLCCWPALATAKMPTLRLPAHRLQPSQPALADCASNLLPGP